MKKIMLAASLLVLVSFKAISQEAIEGTWLTQEGKSKVEIYDKGTQQYAGKIVWMENPTDRDDKPHIDSKNPDKSLRDRTIMGINILDDLVYKNGKWEGTIYTPKRGKYLDVVVSLDSPDILKIQVSYRGFKRNQIWKRSDLSKQ